MLSVQTKSFKGIIQKCNVRVLKNDNSLVQNIATSEKLILAAQNVNSTLSCISIFAALFKRKN